MSMRGTGTFSGGAVLAMLLIGGAAFFAALYFLGTGIGAGNLNNGRGHAASNGLNGYAALYKLLETQDYDVSLSRDRGEIGDTEALLVLTPDQWSNGEQLEEILDQRRYSGPTLVILPKWMAMRVPANAKTGAKEGWVTPVRASSPEWVKDSPQLGNPDVTLSEYSGSWAGFGHSGVFDEAGNVQTISDSDLVPLIENGARRMLAGYRDDGYYPELAASADVDPGDDTNLDQEMWPIVILAEPDLANNWGMADSERAAVAIDLIDASLDGYDLPIVFDLTLNGLGATKNLLTLAVTPPFIAATLCLILAMIAIGWRAWCRFGPPSSEGQAIAFGKEQLVANGAQLLQRTRRLHLLGPPQAALMTRRIAAALGLRTTGDRGRLELEIQRLLNARRTDQGNRFTTALESLRAARSGHEILLAASTLKTIERNLHP